MRLIGRVDPNVEVGMIAAVNNCYELHSHMAVIPVGPGQLAGSHQVNPTVLDGADGFVTLTVMVDGIRFFHEMSIDEATKYVRMREALEDAIQKSKAQKAGIMLAQQLPKNIDNS